MTQAFSNIRIIDFTQVLAGPFATQQLAQLGADVIKIEALGSGDMTRGLMAADSDGMAPSFLTCNLGKRSIAMDLKHPSAKDVVFKLVESADAVVENFKPGTMGRLGFDYETLKGIKPDLVYASISGYGQSGPKSELPAFDGAIQASSGMMSLSGHAESGPVRAGYFSVDMSTSLNAAFAISTALYRRLATGEGQRVDISMMDSAFMMQAPQLTNFLHTGTIPELLGNRSPTKQPTSNVFATSDSFVQVAAFKEPQIKSLLTAIGHGDFYEGRDDPAERVRQTQVFDDLLFPIFKSKTTDEWVEILTEANVPVAPIRDIQQALEDEQNQHRLNITEFPHPSGEGTTRAISAGHIADPAPPSVQRPPPKLGEHTDEVLSEVGYSADEVSALRDAGLI